MSYTFILHPHGDMSWRRVDAEAVARAMAEELRAQDVPFYCLGPDKAVFASHRRDDDEGASFEEDVDDATTGDRK